MKHTIRQHGQLTQIDCEFGTGILDRKGREIIESDYVKFFSRSDDTGCVIFEGIVKLRYNFFAIANDSGYRDLPTESNFLEVVECAND